MAAEEQSVRDRFIEVLRSRGMARPGEEWVVDVNLSSFTHELVAATLRSVAEQVRDPRDRDDLLATAEEVERAEDDACCPLCQEVTCGTDCPLAASRAARRTNAERMQ